MLLIVVKNPDQSAVESQVTDEHARSTASVSAIHLNTDMVALGRHVEVDIDKIRGLRDGPVQPEDGDIRRRCSRIEVDIADADEEVVQGRLAWVIPIKENSAVLKTRGSFESGPVQSVADDLRVD